MFYSLYRVEVTGHDEQNTPHGILRYITTVEDRAEAYWEMTDGAAKTKHIFVMRETETDPRRRPRSRTQQPPNRKRKHTTRPKQDTQATRRAEEFRKLEEKLKKRWEK